MWKSGGPKCDLFLLLVYIQRRIHRDLLLLSPADGEH